MSQNEQSKMSQNEQPKIMEQVLNAQNVKERLLDIESLLLLLESDPCLQEYHQRIFRMMHDILKELINVTD